MAGTTDAVDLDGDDYLPRQQAAEIAGCSVSAIRNWERDGSVDRRKDGDAQNAPVLVRLGDVLDRAGGAGIDPAAEPGTALVERDQLATLIDRIPQSDEWAAAAGKAEATAEQYRHRINELRRERDDAVAKVDHLTAQLLEARQELGELRARIEQADHDRDQRRQELEQVTGERDRLAQRCSTLGDELARPPRRHVGLAAPPAG